MDYTVEIENRLNRISKQLGIDWFHDFQDGGSSYYDIVNNYNFYYYVLHSDFRIDDKEILKSITNTEDGIEFLRLYNDVAWVETKVFDQINICYKTAYKINIQCIISKPMFNNFLSKSTSKDRFIKLLTRQKFTSSREFVQNPYDMCGGWG